jgi:exodeoxyribonuclease VII small subunit
MAKPKSEASFEKNLEELEQIVAALESGTLSLDESLRQFEAGIRLSRACERALADAEQKIEILTKGTEGALEARPFDPETGGPAPGGDADEDEDHEESLF